MPGSSSRAAGSGGQLGFDDLLDDTALPAGAAREAARWARPLVRVTPARLATWESCPRRHRLTYVDRPAPPRGGPRAASTLGAVVHLALRALHLRPPRERTPEHAAALVDRTWSGEGFRDSAQEAEYRGRARDWTADYVAEHVEGAPDPLGVERWVSAPTAAIVAEGRVDRIDATADAAVVVDYKTGRHVPGPADARDSAALALYALGVARTLRRDCRRVELHHLPTGRIAVWEHDEASLAAHVERAERGALAAADAADALARGGDPDALFPPRPGSRCAACDVRRHCPEGQAVGPPAAPWDDLVP
ncbi:RecB family exonuclease [Pseudonocardia sp. RS010]|uniref:RecB family exonuclease n=1 Tax=Pseudonocardia sp. RS010 TaxID=3385979 RepID=UPI00399F2182